MTKAVIGMAKNVDSERQQVSSAPVNLKQHLHSGTHNSMCEIGHHSLDSSA